MIEVCVSRSNVIQIVSCYNESAEAMEDQLPVREQLKVSIPRNIELLSSDRTILPLLLKNVPKGAKGKKNQQTYYRFLSYKGSGRFERPSNN